MSSDRFDELAKQVANGTSRRDFLKRLVGVGAAATVGGAAGAARAAGGGGNCATGGQNCTHNKCCQGYICVVDQPNSTDRFCCPALLVCGSRCCPQGASCASGQRCLCPTNAPTVCTGQGPVPQVGICTNLNTDVNNCGSCGHQCPDKAHATKACVNKTCVYTCESGYASCNGPVTETDGNGCETNLQTDEENCGRCGNQCPTGATCTNGVCLCPTGETPCGVTATNRGACRNLNTDVGNCGTCGNVCPSRANATTTCVQGACGFICNAGFANCDNQDG